MQTKIMSIFTRTPLHVGCGSSVGAVDQPVVRERHTGYPVIPGSAIKGVLADLWMEEGRDVRKISKKDCVEYVRIVGGAAYQLFGANDSRDKDETGEKVRAEAGSLLVGEGRLLAFPVRSARGCFAWLTCPFALERYARDCGRETDKVVVGDGEVLTSSFLAIKDAVVFEEYPFTIRGTIPERVIDMLGALCGESLWHDQLKNRLAIVSDDMFAYFAQNACEIANHNRINDETGVVDDGALFSQENVPSETMFYCVLNTRKEENFKELKEKLDEVKNLLQIGADMTTGLGWCGVELMKEVK